MLINGIKVGHDVEPGIMTDKLPLPTRYTRGFQLPRASEGVIIPREEYKTEKIPQREIWVSDMDDEVSSRRAQRLLRKSPVGSVYILTEIRDPDQDWGVSSGGDPVGRFHREWVKKTRDLWETSREWVE